MGFDWDGVVLANVMPVFAEGGPMDTAGPANLPTYYPGGDLSAGFDLTDAVFDRQYLQLDLLDEQSGVATRRPVIGVRLAVFPSGVLPGPSDLVTVPSVGVTYVVRTVRPDGHGHVLLELNATAPPASGLDFSDPVNSEFAQFAQGE